MSRSPVLHVALVAMLVLAVTFVDGVGESVDKMTIAGNVTIYPIGNQFVLPLGLVFGRQPLV